MKLPNLSNSMSIGRLRYIQSIHEPVDRRNPDTLVGNFIPMLERWRCSWLGRKRLASMRSDPFYYYLLARTMHYDAVFLNAIRGGVNWIINIGCGSDTRAYRFASVLTQHGVKVLECDQRDAIYVKQRIVKRGRYVQDVEYLSLDLNDDAWPEFERWLEATAGGKSLVLMEGVSPYVDEIALRRFLRMLAIRLPVGSELAYDFKLLGADDDFGYGGRTQKPFRLPSARNDLDSFHKECGYRLAHMELSSEVVARLLPGVNSGARLYSQDCLVRVVLG